MEKLYPKPTPSLQEVQEYQYTDTPKQLRKHNSAYKIYVTNKQHNLILNYTVVQTNDCYKTHMLSS